MKYIPHNPHIVEIVSNYLSVYDICRQNRNVLSHFTPVGSLRDEEKIIFAKMKGITGKIDPIPSTLVDIRRVAAEIMGLMTYSWRIYKALDELDRGQTPELPPIIAVPMLLVKPPPQTNQEPNERRPSSQKERRLKRKERRERHHQESA
jgi:hypothetical protein